jgi:hypothetical protein
VPLQQQHQNNIKKLIIAIFLVVFVFIYKSYNPIKSNYFLKCPFLYATGYKCAGCGSQRAVHALLNLSIKDALYYNILLVVAIPYLIIGLFLEIKKDKSYKYNNIYRLLYSTKTTLIILIIIIIFWIIRNTPLWCLY